MHSDCTPQAQRTAYAPPTSHRVKRIRVNSINTDQIIPDPPFIPHTDVPTTIRAQIDTGADLTCTNLIEILHDYSSYSKSFPCRIKLVGAVDSNDGIYPLGEGYIHVPASTKQGRPITAGHGFRNPLRAKSQAFFTRENARKKN